MSFFQLSFLESLFCLKPRGQRQPRALSRRKSGIKRAASQAPELTLLWNQLANQYFPAQPEILEYRISWSTRKQKRTLASCNIRQLRVVVARELNREEHRRWLPALLYHEMCHAAIGMGVQRNGRKRLWHGAQFRSLELRHPEIPALDAWIKSGGWRQAVRSARARSAAETRARNHKEK